MFISGNNKRHSITTNFQAHSFYQVVHKINKNHNEISISSTKLKGQPFDSEGGGTF